MNNTSGNYQFLGSIVKAHLYKAILWKSKSMGRSFKHERTGTEIEQRSGAPETPDRRGVRGGGTRYARLRCHRQARVYHGADGEDWGLPRAEIGRASCRERV